MTQLRSEAENQVAIFKNESGEIEVSVKLIDETAWLSLNQLAEVFGRDKSVISKHLSNIFKEGELEQESTVAKFATVQMEGTKNVTRQIEYYNLDAIISVGYRVNSKRGVEFRRWANRVLKEYLIKGYSINQSQIMRKDLEDLKQTVLLLSNTLINQGLVNDMGIEVLSLIKAYTKTWDILIKYDENRLIIPIYKQNEKVGLLEYETAKQADYQLKTRTYAKRRSKRVIR